MPDRERPPVVQKLRVPACGVRPAGVTKPWSTVKESAEKYSEASSSASAPSSVVPPFETDEALLPCDVSVHVAGADHLLDFH